MENHLGPWLPFIFCWSTMSLHFVVYITTNPIAEVKKDTEVEIHFSQVSLLMIILSFMGQELTLQRFDKNFDVSVYLPDLVT